MAQIYSTRIWTFHPAHRDTGVALLVKLQRIIDHSFDAELCLYQDQGDPERYVTFCTWSDQQALQAFRVHPDATQIQTALQPLLAEVFPGDAALTLDEVMRA